ncbi:hypothetical protein [Streptomyces rubrolavendulae]|uniref:Uncharacterized protein n=1 Tax=Streptomyces rubrolavendulae TaxID=285473 RepID=A0A1D8G8S9_9ACTN|nr:hypothetical protein [Streptomyces rubrolavendulae]AOT61854.1 hypothetical protein A4G23_04745 [Streptomyces rubrolavendulae]
MPLAPGVVLVTVPGGGLAVRTPDGTFLRVDTAGTEPHAATALLTGRPAPDGAPAAAPGTRPGPGPGTRPAVDSSPEPGPDSSPEPGPEPGPDRLTAAFAEAGYTGDTPPPPLTGRTVAVLGDPVLTAPLTRFVRDAGGLTRTVTPEEAAALDGDRTAVVWCLDGPVPPGLWDDADRLPDRGTAWLRTHREGAHAWIEPPATGPGDVTSAHVRLRRLAATPAHRELAALWAGHGTPDNGPRHSEASAALTAALLTADLLAWAAGAPPAVRRRLRRLDLRDLAVTGHPVLPVPDVAPLPAPASGAVPPTPAPAPAPGPAPSVRPA